MNHRTIQEVRVAHSSRDGDGVAIQRISGMQHAGMDPILMIDELRSEQRADFGGGFPPHPHRGMQTLTYMKRGGIIHEDNQGNRGEIRGGGAQWMSAGRGIIHSEMPTQDTTGLHGFQLWINLPRVDKMSAPCYRDVAREELVQWDAAGFHATAVAGRWSLQVAGESAVSLHGPLVELEERASVLDLVLQPDAVVDVRVPETESLLGYLYDGSLVHGTSAVQPRHMLITGKGESWTLEAGPGGANVLLLRGEPLGEPVANYGPFVMNSSAEIEQAIADYQSGAFGEPAGGSWNAS
jgi:redox-sensitive bicupin YhaK (pirin superfamily)